MIGELDMAGGLHSPAEGTCLAELASMVPAGLAIVEVGSYTGVSALRMAEAANQAHVHCIDPWVDPHVPCAMEEFRQRMAEHDWPVTTLRTDSLTAARIWIQPVGLLFIDANHWYEAVRADVEAWVPHLVSGGWLALHDYLGDTLQPDTDVRRVVDEYALRTWDDVRVVDKLWVGRKP